jgi:hypothetical protein
MALLNKKFTDSKVKELVSRYLNKEIKRNLYKTHVFI